MLLDNSVIVNSIMIYCYCFITSLLFVNTYLRLHIYTLIFIVTHTHTHALHINTYNNTIYGCKRFQIIVSQINYQIIIVAGLLILLNAIH